MCECARHLLSALAFAAYRLNSTDRHVGKMTDAGSLTLQTTGSTPSGTLVTAMSRLATENKADRATKGNAHRKRKMAEAFPPSSNAVGITKLNPNSKTLPPLSMGQPQPNAASGSQLQQPSFQGSLVSAAQAPSFAHAASQPPSSLPAMDASKRIKAESAAAMSAPGISFQSASKQSTGSKQAPSTRRAGTSKQASFSRQSSGDAPTRTDGSSRHTASRQPTPPLADCVTSPLAAVLPPGSAVAPGLQAAAQMPQEQQVAFPFRIVKAKAAQPASSAVMTDKSSVMHTEATGQAAASKSAAPAAAAAAAVKQLSGVSACTVKAEVDQAVSVGGENCMDALAEAAAAASEGSAASSSSREHTDDDKDAAEILRDLHNSAERPQNITPDAGECCRSWAPSCQSLIGLCAAPIFSDMRL